MTRTADHDETHLRICFLVGSADISGGTYVIFQHALEAVRRGHDVTIATYFPVDGARPDWHPGISQLRIVSIAEAGDETYDLAIATWWRTVYELPAIRAAAYAYFVQSAEPRFHAHEHDSSNAQLAAFTYSLGLPTITISRWLEAYLHFGFGVPAFCVRNGIDKSRFTQIGPRLSSAPADGRLRILVEGTVNVPMKDTERAVECAAESGAEVWLLTASDIEFIPGADRVISRVPIDQVPSIYRSCDVLLKLSRVEGMYGPPLEMFHCGGTVVTNDVTGSDEYVRDGRNGLIVATGDYGAATDALRRLGDDRALLRELRVGAQRTAAAWPSWSESAAEFVDLLELMWRFEQPDATAVLHALDGARLGLL
jgi:glycosyltransferase involved in cell wall biosynthesis